MRSCRSSGAVVEQLFPDRVVGVGREGEGKQKKKVRR